MAETDPVLAKMLARVAAWQAAADSYRAAMALEQGTDADSPSAGGRSNPIELPVNAFRGMTITEAVKLYLQSVRRKQTVQEIADGLKAGGIESLAKDFGPTLRSILHQGKKRGELLRFKDGWDLAEAHSTALRNRLANQTTTVGRKNGRKKKSAKAKSAKTKSAKAAGPRGPSLDERVLAYVKLKPMEWFTPKQIADALNEPEPRYVNMAIARLVRYAKIAKHDDGRYAATR